MSEYAVYVAFILVFFFIYYWFIRKTRTDKILSTIKGPLILPLIGNFLEFLGPQEDAFDKLIGLCKRYGTRFRTYILGNYFVMLHNPEDVEKVLNSQVNLEKGKDYDLLKSWLGTGLLTSTGEKWFTRRKMLTPAFHFKILEDFMPIFNDHTLKMVQILKEECTNGKFDISPYITRCTLDIICETAMGKKIDAQNIRNSDYCSAIIRMAKLIQLRSLTPWYRPEFIWSRTSHGIEQKKVLATLHGFTEKVIQEKKHNNAKSKTRLPAATEEDEFQVRKKLAFLDLLLEQQQKNPQALTDIDIREETDTFMFEGHDTTSTSLNFTLFLIGCYPEVQAKIHRELDEIYGNDRSRPVVSQDLTKMKYLDCVIKESLRLYPSVPFIERLIEKDIVLNDGQIIPKGVTTFLVIFQMHRNPETFDDPLEFKPERFQLENNEKRRNPFAYIPFSAGPRNCIGQKFAVMEEKVLLANVMRNFKIEAAETREDLKLLGELVLRSHHGINVRVKCR